MAWFITVEKNMSIREDTTIHTNTIEGLISIFKRGIKGIYQHCGKQNLHRYLAELIFAIMSGSRSALMI